MKGMKLLKRWFNMLTGKSSFHVKQGKGKYYCKQKIKGYYNDLTNKISEKTILDSDGIPINTTITNLETYFPISIFQYGLGLYDKYIETNDSKYFDKFINIAEWAINNIDKRGMWDCMGKLNDKAHESQSSMCQSEGASVLFRAFISTGEKKYYDIGIKAIDFMLLDIKEGGTSLYRDDDLIFQEYVSKYDLSVLNGWIFSIFGLYDCTLLSNNKKYKNALDKTLNSLINNLKKYDRNYWSNYDTKGTIASPAYHDLHIMQLRILYDLFNIESFKYYSDKWAKKQSKRINVYRAMIIKLKQKITKNKYYDINTSLVK